MENTYKVVKINSLDEIDNVEKVKIANFPWDKNGYRPLTYAQVAFIKNVGFSVRLYTYEENPRAIFEKPDDPVCEDSCLEFFINPYPKVREGYLNFECNAKGTLLCQYGVKRVRNYLKKFKITPPTVSIFDGSDENGHFWGVSYIIDLPLIKAAYGNDKFPSGHVMAGNFYKCGDKTAKSHYGCWNNISMPHPDFHTPDFFGDFIIE